MGVAFFDLDRTLLAVNSAVLWVRAEVAAGHVRRRDAARGALWFARYQLGWVPEPAELARAVALLAGTDAEALRARTRAFYLQAVRGRYRPGALAALAEHRRRGDRRVLLTSSSGYLADLVAAELDLEATLCNRFELDAGGRHTGRTLGPLCFGEGKRAHAEAYAREAGVPLADCAFYTDSFTDLSVLEVVGHPVAVHPDPRLRREAARRGWPVVDWGVPAASAGTPATGAPSGDPAGAGSC